MNFFFEPATVTGMTWVVVGLGNPGEEYVNTRHNAGRMMLEAFAKKHAFSEWKEDKKANAQVSNGAIGPKGAPLGSKNLIVLVNPDTLMNRSGTAVVRFVKSVKAAEKLIVVHDDLDLPLGKLKVSFGRGSGGHRGIDSIMRLVKTKNFVRIRIGVSPTTPSGKLKKPLGEEAVVKFILARFKEAELDELKKVFRRAGEALEMIVTLGREVAMTNFN